MIYTNKDKAEHGRNAQVSLQSILTKCVEVNYLSSYTKDYRIGKTGYNNSKQFYSPFLIEFEDGTKWIIFNTTSMRTDRIKGNQWDALNIKNIDTSITKAYIIYPDSLPSTIKNEFIRQNKKIKNQDEFSAIDEILSQDCLYNLIEKQAIQHKNKGQQKDIQGNNFETRVANILSDEINFKKWVLSDTLQVGMHYDIFETIVNCFHLEKENIKKIDATSDKKIIGKLPTGGFPKTDILVSVIDKRSQKHFYTISCKRSDCDSVSVHQYNADSFAAVLDKNNSNLKQLLNKFQTVGNLRDFGEENINLLTKELKPYKIKLLRWVLGGHGGSGNPQTQNANYILTYNNQTNSTSIYTLNDYCKKLSSTNTSGHFGTPFSWTYPSKRKSKDIQLKCKILD